MPVYHPGIKFQTVYLIHGGGDDDTLPFRYTNVERYAEDNCVMLVCPDIANSFGLDTSYGKKYSTFLCEELPVLIRSYFPSSPERKDNFIVGYAMGGNAALGNALLHPENYSFCVDLSGGIGFTPRTQMLKDELESEHFSHFPVEAANSSARASRATSRPCARWASSLNTSLPRATTTTSTCGTFTCARPSRRSSR